MGTSDWDVVLAEQQAYYRVFAPEYSEAAKADPTEVERGELESVLASFDPAGHVLDIAGGTGHWTVSLARYADRLTVLDSSAECLNINRTRLAGASIPIEHVAADIFDWQPSRRYDVVFFSYWLSHVPTSHFDAFWATVDAALLPGGRVFFIDEAWAIWDEAQGELSRRQSHGREYNIVKICWEPALLEERLATIGFDVMVGTTKHGYCIYGHGGRTTQ